MTDITETPIRHRPDGSIDTAYYMAHGRRLRSEAAHRMARGPEEHRPEPRRGLFSFLAL